MSQPIRVLIVDDSALMRLSITRFLETDPAIQVVGSARDGREALERIIELRPDVLTLDIEMPHIDGLTALQRIMAECPLPVIMLSSRTKYGARSTIQALMRGAVDFVPKPDDLHDTHSVMAELIEKIKAVAPVQPRAPLPDIPVAVPHRKPELQSLRHTDWVVVIGASTGGPRALEQLFANLPPRLSAAVMVVQHMPAGFTQTLAQRLNENYPFRIREAADHDQLARGLALLAPGNQHLRFTQHRRIALDSGPRRNHVRPSIDVTMESAVEMYGSRVIGVLLTGMGTDGTAGARCIKAAGGQVIAEHESTCVVYGMPRSVIEAGLADLVVPLPDMAAAIARVASYERLGV